MSMLSTLDVLEATENGASVPRAGVFQPKVKARVRKGGGRGDGGAAKPPAAPVVKPSPAVPFTSTSNALDINSAAGERGVSQPTVKAADAFISKESESAPGLSNGIADESRDVIENSTVIECVPQEAAKVTSPRRSDPVEPVPDDSSTHAAEADDVLAESPVNATSQESPLKFTQDSSVTTQEFSQPVAVRSTFPIPSSSTQDEEAGQENALPRSEEPSSDSPGNQEGESNGVAEPARASKLKNNARKTRKTATTSAASDVPSTSSKEAVDDDVEETLFTLDDELIAAIAREEEHTSTSAKKRKRAFPHSTCRGARGQRQTDADSSGGSKPSKLDCDLSNPSILPLREVIRRAENIERRKAKEEISNKSATDASKPKRRDTFRERTPPRDVLSLAPQVQIVDGRIVVNEQSLTVGAYATSTQDKEQYTRVEEKASRLNYHTYSNRTVTERWKPEETDFFYNAIRQFGTDFDLIKNLFPTRTRRQIKSKYKKEESVNPRRIADALTYRPKDQSHYEEMLARMNKDHLIQDTSDPFASILAYSVERTEDKAEVDDTQAEEETLASIVQ